MGYGQIHYINLIGQDRAGHKCKDTVWNTGLSPRATSWILNGQSCQSIWCGTLWHPFGWNLFERLIVLVVHGSLKAGRDQKFLCSENWTCRVHWKKQSRKRNKMKQQETKRTEKGASLCLIFASLLVYGFGCVAIWQPRRPASLCKLHCIIF